MSRYLYHHHSGGGGGGGLSGPTPAPTIGAALDELMCGKSDGSLSSASSSVSPNSVYFRYGRLSDAKQIQICMFLHEFRGFIVVWCLFFFLRLDVLMASTFLVLDTLEA